MLPGIHQPQSHQAGDRRRDVAIDQIQLGVVDLRLVGFDGALILSHQRRLGVQLLLRNRVLLDQRLVSIQIEVRVLEQRLIVDELTFRLLQLHFIRPRIDLLQQIALMNDLPLFEQHLHQLPGDAGIHGDGVNGRHRAQTRNENLDVALRGSRRHHLRRTSAPAAPSPASALRRALPGRVAARQKGLQLRPLPIADPRQRQQHQPPDPTATGGRLRRTGPDIGWPVGRSLQRVWLQRRGGLERSGCGVLHIPKNQSPRVTNDSILRFVT